MKIMYFCVIYVGEQQVSKLHHRRDRIVVSTLRCGRNNPGSNPGLDNNFSRDLIFVTFAFMMMLTPIC